VGLILLATLLVVGAGIALGPWPAPKLGKALGFHNSQLAIHNSRQPDWGGGELSLAAGSVAGILDSVRTSSGKDSAGTQTYAGRSGGAVLREKSGGDHALTLALTSPGQPGRVGVFELPSTRHFQKQLLPGTGDAEAPANDVPLYPRSSCRMQVGRGTACFVGFYLTPDSVEAVRSFYVRALSRLGWQRVTTDRQGLLETFAKNGEDRTVVVQLRKEDSAMTRIGLVATTAGRSDRSMKE
jgi:hypothetical protein